MVSSTSTSVSFGVMSNLLPESTQAPSISDISLATVADSLTFSAIVPYSESERSVVGNQGEMETE
eukprot:965997-Rhodomonas_salina.1